jgi:putative two-component system response regulator
MKVLIVDDDEVSLEVLSHVLTESGHEVESACDGVEALEILRGGECRLVISDWMMPRMNGLELCRQVRRMEFSGYVYFILLTGREGTENVVTGLSAGADDFLTKPFDPAELRVRIRSAERVLSLETRDVAIFALAKLAESRDPETGAHLERVRAYSRLIAAHFFEHGTIREDVDDDFVRLIYVTSPLHDIGKVGIPDAVLLKPGRLSDREFEIMKAHTTIGAETLDAALHQFPGVNFLRMARDIALTHHERFDGSGYPHGLSGEAIPLCGRIVALADVYDALTTKRVYKAAFTHEVARGVMLKESGNHFDPEIVEVFFAYEDQFVSIHEELSEPALVTA